MFPRRCLSQGEIHTFCRLVEDSLAQAFTSDRRHNCSTMPSQPTEKETDLIEHILRKRQNHPMDTCRAVNKARKQAGVNEVNETTVYRYINQWVDASPRPLRSTLVQRSCGLSVTPANCSTLVSSYPLGFASLPLPASAQHHRDGNVNIMNLKEMYTFRNCVLGGLQLR